MRILHLSLTNFRNYSRLELDLPQGVVLLQGDNAQGKTNLLEAIYYLSRARSPRTGADRELLNWLALEEDLPFARLVAQVERGDETAQIEISLVQNSTRGPNGNGMALRKHIRVNGANKRAVDMVGLLRTVLFLPQDIDMVAGAPHIRRRYLDDTISQLDSRYYQELQRYSRVLMRRNYLLKSLRGRSDDAGQLTFWDQRLVQHGVYVIARRQQVIQQLDASVQDVHRKLTGDRERLRLEYCASVRTEAPPGAVYQIGLPTELVDGGLPELSPELRDVAASFAAQLQEARSKELEQGMSILGPHRDDLRFLVDGVDMAIYGSRGQQRTIALSMKLAEVQLMVQGNNDKPVLLLDDVISELDLLHRRCLLDAIDQAQQVIITATDVAPYGAEFLERAVQWRVCAGRIQSAV